MDTFRDLAGRLDEAAATLDAAASTVVAVGPTDRSFGADAPGRLGDLGRALHEQWVVAADTRAREAIGAARLLADAAASLRVVAASYVDTDDAARRRHAEEP